MILFQAIHRRCCSVVLTGLATSCSHPTTSIGLRTSILRFIFVDIPVCIIDFPSSRRIRKSSVFLLSTCIKCFRSLYSGELIMQTVVFYMFRLYRSLYISVAYTRPAPMITVMFQWSPVLRICWWRWCFILRPFMRAFQDMRAGTCSSIVSSVASSFCCRWVSRLAWTLLPSMWSFVEPDSVAFLVFCARSFGGGQLR